MLIKIYGAAVQGVEAITVTIEISTSRGIRYFLVGLPDVAVKESHERIRAALLNTGFKLPTMQTIINMAPADIRKEGSAYDLPLAIGLLAATGVIKDEQARLSRYMMMGELSLDGGLKEIKGALPIAIKARSEGFDGLIVPEQNVHEAAVVNNLKVIGVKNLTEVVKFFNGETELSPTIIDTRAEFAANQKEFEFDFVDVKGQEHVKRALEIAASGGHNVIMIGPPGAGKSMMAKRMPSILPPLSLSESLETTQIHSIAGKLGSSTSLIAHRPFRSPHHSISSVALIGGGSNPEPGEISLAHNGILYLDELPEFSRSALETLRQPLEDRHITIARAKYSIEYPCSFMFVSSMNPCPCGYYNHPTKNCQCTSGQIQRYMNKISGPLMDRIDIQIEITPVPFEELSKAQPGETSEEIRKRVIRARKVQEERYKDHKGIHCNAQMTSRLLHQYAEPDAEGAAMLQAAMKRLDLSARAYDRILKVARTIADLAGSEKVLSEHIAEAIGYRNLDRGSWGER